MPVHPLNTSSGRMSPSAPSEPANQPEDQTHQQLMQQAETCLADRFQLPGFRNGQREVISALLAGRNVAAVFPTGGGKSLCYQLPSQLLPGTTVVVSPLIALMKDQCDALAERGIRAVRLDSTLSEPEYRQAIRSIRDGSTKLLYVAPERFFNERFVAAIGHLNVSLFAIDEAHCISQWGHNFRPDYLKLAELATRLKAERVLALTATAPPPVLQDIRDTFSIAEQDAIRTPFFRANLQLNSSVVTAEEQYDVLLERIQSRPPGPTLIYVTKQKTAEEIAERLTADDVAALPYHAGLPAEERERVQQHFLESETATVVATIAFGMGIDKSDLRYVYHFNLPKSLESYAQEIGRAGRDGKPSTCELLLCPDDRVILENFVYGDSPDRRRMQHLLEIISGQPEEFHLSYYHLSHETDIRPLVMRTLLTYLELDGYLQATSPRYNTYKIHPLVTSEAILANFDGERKTFLSGVLGQLTKGRKWFLLDVTGAAKALNEDRSRIVKAVEFMAAQNWIEVQVSDLVHGYRVLKPMESVEPLVDRYCQRIDQRESNEVERLDKVIQLALAKECLSAALSEHFGETLSKPCGQCTHCRGEGEFTLPELAARPIGDAATRAILEISDRAGEILMSARDRARFLCGMATPKMQRKRLTREPGFGVCDHIAFADVVKQVEALGEIGHPKPPF